MNRALATLAEQRANEGAAPRSRGYCQQWVRLRVQELYGGIYDTWLWQASAKRAGEVFWTAAQRGQLPAGVEVLRTSDPAQTQVGDILYRTTSGGAYGHVSIRVSGNCVAENSSVHQGAHGAVGFRALDAVVFDTVVRLPEPAAKSAPVPQEQPAEWAAEAWAEMKRLGVLDGARPQGPVTREELAVVLHRLKEQT